MISLGTGVFGEKLSKWLFASLAMRLTHEMLNTVAFKILDCTNV